MNGPMPAPTCLSCQHQAAVIALLQEQNALLEARIKALEAKLGANSTNSHRPPSSDPPHKPASSDKNRQKRRAKTAKTRKQGAQPGHKHHKRTLVALSDLDELHVHKPLNCSTCCLPLEGTDPDPVRHQIVELPPIKHHVTEHQLHRLSSCPQLC